MDSRILQLADSAFPSGSFAHSLGLEALRQLGGLRGEAQLALRLRELCWNTAHAALPFLNDAHQREPENADRAADVFLSQHVANRASRAQGQAFLLAAEAAFDNPIVTSLRQELPFGHVAVVMGAALKLAGFELDDARQVFLFGAVRSALSAAVRLGVVGPLRGQKLLFELHGELDRALATTRELTSDQAASVSPLVDCAQGVQDRLYSRLFQS